MNNEDRNLIAKQHCNKLIAEFMGVPQGEHTHFMVEPFALESYANVDDLKYDISWDWLMPVVSKITRDEQYWEDDYREHLMDIVPYGHIEDTYDAVVQFIKAYNDGKQ